MPDKHSLGCSEQHYTLRQFRNKRGQYYSHYMLVAWKLNESVDLHAQVVTLSATKIILL